MIKRLNKIGLLILTILSIFIVVNSRYFLKTEDLHKENFVMISLTKFFNDRCEEEEDSGIESSIEDDLCIPGKIPIYESTASGLLIKKIRGITYILTANHFCNSDIIDSRYPSDSRSREQFEDLIMISDSTSRTYRSEIAYADKSFDLCLLESKIERDVSTIKFSDMPDIGEKIFTIASPLGISESGILLHFEGFFSGCESTGICFYTIPATSGSSGSVVFDMKGRAIGIIQMTPVYFRSMSLGVGSKEIISFLESASREIGVDLI